ncbi:MAG: hypothetical protein IT319_19060 [Anaerolineae bacterium]|nr:hypothetical protein [Anaerolineae bacterium]
MSFFATRLERLVAVLNYLAREHDIAMTEKASWDDSFIGGVETSIIYRPGTGNTPQTRIEKIEFWQALIQHEKDLLEAAQQAGEAADQDFEQAALWWFRSLTDPESITSAVASDPVLLERTTFPLMVSLPVINSQIAQSILLTPRPNVDPYPSSLLAQIRANAGTDTAYQEFVTAAYRVWLQTEDRPYFYDDVIVTLPVRLETIFKPRADDPDYPYTMFLRVVPDEASITRFEPLVSPVERDLLRELWQHAYDCLPDKTLPISAWLTNRYPPINAGIEETRIAWNQFCSRVGGGRAAWLVSTFLPTVENNVVQVDIPAEQLATPEQPYTPSRVSGFPKTVEVYAAFNGGEPQHLASLQVKTEELTLDLPKNEADRWNHWSTLWKTPEDVEPKRGAVDVGLGAEIPIAVPPEQISELFIVGISDEHPAEHFTALANSGEMAYLDVGMPTNSVNGKPAADLGKDPSLWQSTVSTRLFEHERGRIFQRFSSTFSGTDNFPILPLSQATFENSNLLVRALWHALWGHYLKDLWGFGEEAHAIGLWAGDNLYPEGPLPPLRIGTQPYGLLPVSRLGEWQVRDSEGERARVETGLRNWLLPLRDRWAEIGKSKPRAVGATARELLDLIGQDALSTRYRYRTFYPAELIYQLYQVKHPEIDRQRLEEWFRAQYRAAASVLAGYFGVDPEQLTPAYYAAQGSSHRLRLPLIVPTRMPITNWDGTSLFFMNFDDAVIAIREETFIGPEGGLMGRYRDRAALYDHRLPSILPDSLLLRLMIYSRWLSAACVVQADQGDQSPLLEPPVAPAQDRTKIENLVLSFNENLLANGHPASELHQRLIDAYDQLTVTLTDSLDVRDMIRVREGAQPTIDALERSFRAVLDTAAHRIDPWITGFAWRRLRHLQGQETTRFRLGIYGWVDGPIRGVPGPNEAGLFHAPSYGQALAGVLLRDRYLTAEREGDAGRWEIKIESSLVRLAQEMADEARVGAHIWEILGRRIERIFSSFTEVKALRAAYPMRIAPAQHKTVCNGQAALDDLLNSALNGIPNQAGLSVTPENRDMLLQLRRALETHADLLVAEGAYQTIAGRADIAGAAMEAAAGLNAVPSLDFLRTPQNGLTLNTSVIAAVPYVPLPQIVDAATSPGSIADPSVAALLERLFGAPAQWTWTSGEQTITLATLNLTPVDTLALSTDLLQHMAAYALGVAPTVQTPGTGKDKHRLARQVVKVLGKQPALFENLARQESDDLRPFDASITQELRTRYVKLRDAAQAAVVELQSAAADAERRNSILRALRWGIAPMLSEAEERALFASEDDPEALAALVESGVSTLTTRLSAVPEILTGEFAPPVPGAAVPSTLRQPQQIAAAIAQLVTPEGEFAVMGAMHRQTLQSVTQIVSDDTLSDDWLPVVAAVRQPLANLEALQLEAALKGGFEPLATASSAPGDHWGTQAVAELTADLQPAKRQLPRFVAAFGVEEAWAGETVAVVLVDSWTETIPLTQRTTTAAFGFNAPASRPPQAILLAVSPQLKQPIDAPALLDIVRETRLLMAGRAVCYEDTAEYAGFVPFTMFQAVGRSGVRLNRDVIWEP